MTTTFSTDQVSNIIPNFVIHFIEMSHHNECVINIDLLVFQYVALYPTFVSYRSAFFFVQLYSGKNLFLRKNCTATTLLQASLFYSFMHYCNIS